MEPVNQGFGTVDNFVLLHSLIEQTGMSFDNDFGYSFSLPSYKSWKKKSRINRKNRDQKSCLSARSHSFGNNPIIRNVVDKLLTFEDFLHFQMNPYSKDPDPS